MTLERFDTHGVMQRAAFLGRPFFLGTGPPKRGGGKSEREGCPAFFLELPQVLASLYRYSSALNCMTFGK